MPRTFQGRLTIAFVAVIALTLLLVLVIVLNRLDDYFTSQQTAELKTRSDTISRFVIGTADQASGSAPVVGPDGSVDPNVIARISSDAFTSLIADSLGQSNVTVELGQSHNDGETTSFVPAIDGSFEMINQTAPRPGQTQADLTVGPTEYYGGGIFQPYAVRITLSDPYTYRATAIANVTGLLAAVAIFALGLSVLVSSALARRFTTPLRQLTETARDIAEGDLSRRVPTTQMRSGPSEIVDLGVQFNTMADRVEESVEVIRRDRDRDRDFLADVSHELRTPLAALRTFNQLLMEGAAEDPDARGEFLESSAGQIDRLDWLAQNLLELSKLDSGLVLLDLRPDDLRAAVESAAHQHDALAERRGVKVELDLPARPVRIRHDPPRIGQVVANLVGNAVKFTPRDGVVRVSVESTTDGARIDVADTGVGIDANELPHIFERFYRGSRANEARGSGSGLGLAIVRSIVDIHGGTVSVESGPGTGSRFTVRLPMDPRSVEGTPAAEQSDVASAAEGTRRIAAVTQSYERVGPSDPSQDAERIVEETSPSDAPQVNPASAP
jgi:signal transduction histidine kinase